MATGGQCVMMDGTVMMLPQCVDNWDTTIVSCTQIAACGIK